MQKYINLLMIPTDYCNMRCKYCFFDKNIHSKHRMDEKTLYQVMKTTLPVYDRVSFVWHGGEPLSMGLEFYKDVIRIQNELSMGHKVEINNSVQSNLTLLTDEMANFFASNNFSMSTSYDGICNEITRGNSSQILEGRSKWLEYQDNCGVIMVASKININTLIESYLFFKEHDINFKINPYLGTDEALLLDYDIYLQNMFQLFEYWALDSKTKIIITSFAPIIDYILFHKKSLCTYTSCLGRWASIYYDGTIKPCNRYFPDEYSYGNIFDYRSFDEAFESNGFKKLITKAIERRYKCKECEIFGYCSGGCNYVAMTENGGIENNNGKYCYYLRTMYKFIEAFLIEHQSDEKLNQFLKKRLNKSNRIKGDAN